MRLGSRMHQAIADLAQSHEPGPGERSSGDPESTRESQSLITWSTSARMNGERATARQRSHDGRLAVARRPRRTQTRLAEPKLAVGERRLAGCLGWNS